MQILKTGIALAFVAAAFAPASVLASVGEIFYSDGAVKVTRAGLESRAGAGFKIEIGDVVSTGPDSQVRIKMSDDSYFALPGNSSLKIDEFALPQRGRKRKPGTAVFSLLRGGLRTISGLIGNWSRDTYKLNSPVVTMGIRGTEYSIIYCKDSSCGPGAADGGYVEVLSGMVTASNKEGSGEFREGQWAAINSPPAAAATRPQAFVNDKSGIFDPAARIDVVPGAPKNSAGAGADIRIEVIVEPTPVSPAAPQQ